jgi:hypothetical protein
MGTTEVMQAAVLLWIAIGIGIGTLVSYLYARLRATRSAAPMANADVPVVKGSVSVIRPNPQTVEGLEIQYGPQGLVRAVRVGAMNSEHKELLLTMDDVVWRSLPNAHKQEVLAAARSTWAAKMCPDGPDIAYVVLKTEAGEILGRADPHSVRIL